MFKTAKLTFRISQARAVKAFTLLIIFISVLSLAGCERKYYLKAHYIKGYLHTPWGKFKFQRVKSKRQAKEMHLYYSFDKWPGYLYADAGDVFVVLSLNGDYTTILADKNSPYGRPNYRLNIIGKETKYLSESSEYLGQVWRGNIVDSIPSGSGFAGYHGKGFKKRPSKGGHAPHRTYIPFKLSEDQFLIDVVVKSTMEGYWETDIGPPGMP